VLIFCQCWMICWDDLAEGTRRFGVLLLTRAEREKRPLTAAIAGVEHRAELGRLLPMQGRYGERQVGIGQLLAGVVGAHTLETKGSLIGSRLAAVDGTRSC